MSDSYTTTQDTALVVAAPGVLANDTDPNGDALTAVLVTNPAHGTLTLNADGSFTYTPTGGYTGPDSFIYRARDASNNLEREHQRGADVVALPGTPVAAADAYSTNEDATLTVDAAGVLANDTDTDGPLTAVLVTGPSHGTLTLNAQRRLRLHAGGELQRDRRLQLPGQRRHAAEQRRRGRADRQRGERSAGRRRRQLRGRRGCSLTVSGTGVLANDSDIRTAVPLTAVLVTGPAHGTLTLNADGTFTYTPAPNYNGPDSFIYRASDGVTRAPTPTVIDHRHAGQRSAGRGRRQLHRRRGQRPDAQRRPGRARQRHGRRGRRP